MKKFTLVIVLFSFPFVQSALANYNTPGTGVKFSLTDLVAASGGDVTYSDTYLVNDTVTISLNDTLYINSNATVKFALGTFFEVNGAIIIDPPTGVLFTAQNPATGYLGMRININSKSVLRKLTFEYAVSLRLSDCSPRIDSCTFQFNNNSSSTSFGNGAIALFRSSPVITNSRFLSNQRAAIQGGANIANSPKIYNCLFMDNNTTAQNVPQINLGATGADTARIINNQILRSSNRSGGIGFLPVGDVYVVISGNVIKNNRYGITFNGGNNINALVSYNVIDSNNTEGNPLTGGSGIAFSGGSATSHQNAVVTGNYIRWNLWGITVGPTSTGGGAKPNFGDLSNADTTDDGKNWIYGNNNASTPRIDLYNNNVDAIQAQNNYWGSDNPDSVEARIFHRTDNAALGLVNYSNFKTLPLTLVAFNASPFNGFVVLSWRTVSERGSDYFTVEKSTDGRAFYPLGKVAASGNVAAGRDYQFRDIDAKAQKQFYRLKIVDKDGRYVHSNVIAISSQTSGVETKIYPSVFQAGQALTAEISSNKRQRFLVQIISVEGKVLQQFFVEAEMGVNTFLVKPGASLPAGRLWMRFAGADETKTVTVVKQ